MKELQTEAVAIRTRSNIYGLLASIIDHHVIGVKIYLKSGIDLSLTDDKGNTALDVAMRYRNEEIIRLLSKAGARCNNYIRAC